jgi:uncharacterized protein (DUF58 family)
VYPNINLLEFCFHPRSPRLGGLVLAVVVGTALVNPSGSAKLALAFYVLGFVFFFIAKISVFRSGRLITFGAQPMRPAYRVVYRTGLRHSHSPGYAIEVKSLIWKNQRC